MLKSSLHSLLFSKRIYSEFTWFKAFPQSIDTLFSRNSTNCANEAPEQDALVSLVAA